MQISPEIVHSAVENSRERKTIAEIPLNPGLSISFFSDKPCRITYIILHLVMPKVHRGHAMEIWYWNQQKNYR